MDALEIAQLVLRILLAAALVALGLSQRWWRIQKYLMEFVIPGALVGQGAVEAQTRRARAIANGMLAASVVGGIALLAPWEPVRFAVGMLLAVCALAIGVWRFLGSRAYWREPAFRGELALDWSASAVAPALIALAVV